MIRIALCDDNERYMAMLEKRVRDYCQENDKKAWIETYTDSSELMDDTVKGKLYDAYILDIEMPDYTGIEIIEEIGTHSQLPQIILLTAHASYAVEACGTNVLRYVLKESLNRELPGTLDKMFLRLEKQYDQNVYVIHNQQRFVKLLHRDILYIQKEKKNVVFTLTEGRTEKERITLQEVYKRLDDKDMMFLDRGIIINLRHIKGVQGNEAVMDNGYVISTHMTHISELKKRLNQYVGGLM